MNLLISFLYSLVNSAQCTALDGLRLAMGRLAHVIRMYAFSAVMVTVLHAISLTLRNNRNHTHFAAFSCCNQTLEPLQAALAVQCVVQQVRLG